MLLISNEKMRSMDKEIRKPDKAELRAGLAKMFSSLPPDELDRFIETGLEKAAGYGLDEHIPIKDFIRLMIVVAQDFDEQPKVREQLTRGDVDPNWKVRLACELVTPAEWQEAAKCGTRATIRREEEYVQGFSHGVLSPFSV